MMTQLPEPVETLSWTPPNELMFLTQDDPGILTEVVAAFREDAENRLKRMRDAAACGDRAKIRFEAHALKGGSRQMGLWRLAAICQEIESSAMSLSPSELGILVEQVRASFVDAGGRMTEYLHDVSWPDADGPF
jgi:HPt (histidine-containing phosphotransfer) domain-containing protein